MRVEEMRRILRDTADPDIAAHTQRFFKNGKGEYGEGDRFLGIRMPVLRAQAKRFRDIPLTDISVLLESAFHEERLLALLLMVRRFQRADADHKAAVYRLYLSRTAYINNWDLVDSSAPQIVGAYLADKDRSLLYELAQSAVFWERRIAIMATFYFIRRNDVTDALEISAILVEDKEDLIHKAVGWMLREIGKRNPAAEKAFLKVHYQNMPRTMLRYAIEKFPEAERKRYLKGQV